MADTPSAARPIAALWNNREPMTWLNMLLVPWAGVVAVLSAVVVIPFALAAAVIPRGRRERFCFWTNQVASWGMLRIALLCIPHIEHRDRLPKGDPYLMLCNHRSFVDVLFMIWAGRTQGISKSSVFWFPVMGLLGYLGGAVFFDRKVPEQRQRAKDEVLMLLGAGRAMHVFPEGTRTRDGEIQERVYTGLVRAAWERGVQVVPAAVWGTDTVIPPTNKGVRFFQHAWVRFGHPIQVSDHPDFESFFAAAWGETARMAAELKQAHPHSEVDLSKESRA